MDEILKTTKKILSGQPISYTEWMQLAAAAGEFLERDDATSSQKTMLKSMLNLLDKKKQLN